MVTHQASIPIDKSKFESKNFKVNEEVSPLLIKIFILHLKFSFSFYKINYISKINWNFIFCKKQVIVNKFSFLIKTIVNFCKKKAWIYTPTFFRIKIYIIFIYILLWKTIIRNYRIIWKAFKLPVLLLESIK